jgi:hypothetical protein
VAGLATRPPAGPRHNHLAEGGDKRWMSANCSGAGQVHRELPAQSGCLGIQVVEHLHVVRRESDGSQNQIGQIPARVPLPDVVADVRPEPWLRRRPGSALVRRAFRGGPRPARRGGRTPPIVPRRDWLPPSPAEYVRREDERGRFGETLPENFLFPAGACWPDDPPTRPSGSRPRGPTCGRKPRSVAGFTTFGTPRLRNWQRVARPIPPRWRWPGTCPAQCWKSTATSK